MRIGIVFSWFIFNKHGGTERVLADFCNAMIARGHELTVYSPDHEAGDFLFQIDSRVNFKCYGEPNESFLVTEKGIKLRTFFIINKNQRKEKRQFLRRHKFCSYMRKNIDVDKMDVFVTFSVYATYLMKKAFGHKFKKPIITMIHTFLESAIEEVFPTTSVNLAKIDNLGDDLKKELEDLKKTVSTSNVIQVLRPEYVDPVRSFFRTNKVICIPNTVPQFIEQSHLANRTIIHVGRLCEVKRQHLIVQAFALLRKKLPDWRVELWGDYSDLKYTEYVQNVIDTNNLQDHVKLCGPTNCVKEKLLQASIFAFPSRFEGFPLALTEAMSLGLPSVGFHNCPSVNTLIVNQVNGLLCDDNVEDFAQALSVLMESYKLRIKMGEEAKKSMKLYSPEVVWDKWEDVLFNVYKR